LTLVAGFWFFLTPIVYPGPASGWLRFNPVTPLLETSRSWLAGMEVAPGFFLIVGLAAVALAAAWLLYRLARPHVIARLG
jgi:lipopolysaccharide transport system permease protein